VSTKTVQIWEFLNCLHCTNLCCRFLRLNYQPFTELFVIIGLTIMYSIHTSISISPAGINVSVNTTFINTK
jgi:hypothetical protein